MIIYKATNIHNGKVYIGLTTKTLENRKKEHYRSSIKDDYNYRFSNAIKKYGMESFKWDIIDHAESFQELCEKETKWIKYHKSFENGYNMTLGGEGFKGVNRTGEKNSRAILTEDNVFQILNLLNENKKTLKEIGEIFNVGEHVISNINEGRTWTHLYKKPLVDIRRKVNNKHGERNAKAKLTDEQVYDIKRKLTHGATRTEIINEFNISYRIVQRIILETHWKHVEYRGFHVKVELEEMRNKENEIIQIKNMMSEGIKNQEIKKFFNGKYSNITLSNIRNGKIYKDINSKKHLGKTYVKLTEVDVKKIKELLHKGVRQNEIAKTFNVSIAAISKIKLGKMWAHI